MAHLVQKINLLRTVSKKLSGGCGEHKGMDKYLAECKNKYSQARVLRRKQQPLVIGGSLKFKIGLILFSLMIVSCSPVSSKEVSDECQHTDTTFKCVKYIRNYDGDTITVKIPGLHPLFGQEISVRIAGVDTPEIRTKNKCEKNKALQAKRVVGGALSEAHFIQIKNVERGKYFRIVGDVIVNGKSMKDLLLAKKLAYLYDGGRKQKVNWCK